MKQYGKLDLRNMDCMELMAEYEDNHFDLAITSPPYNAKMHCVNGSVIPRKTGTRFGEKYKGCPDQMPLEEYEKFTIGTLTEMTRVAGLVFWNIQLLTGNRQPVFSALGALSGLIKDVVIWNKGSAEPCINEGMLNAQFEMIVILSRDGRAKGF